MSYSEKLQVDWLRAAGLMKNLQLANDADFVTNVLKLDDTKDSALTFSEFRDFLNREILIRILEAVRKDKPIPGSKYDPTFDVPQDIMNAAQKVAIWAEIQGWRNWVIGPVADRRLTGL